MNFHDIFNIIDFFQIFVEHKHQWIFFEKFTNQFSLFIALYLYNKYNTLLILLK